MSAQVSTGECKPTLCAMAKPKKGKTTAAAHRSTKGAIKDTTETAQSAKYTTTKKAKKEKAPTPEALPPLSLRTWRLLHVKVVQYVLEAAMIGLGEETTSSLKRKVFEFLGPLPAGVKLLTYCYAQSCEPGNEIMPHRNITKMGMIDAGSGKIEKTEACGDRLQTAFWNTSGTKLATLSFDSYVRIIDASNGLVQQQVNFSATPNGVDQYVANRNGETACVFAVAWQPSGKLLATACMRKIHLP